MLVSTDERIACLLKVRLEKITPITRIIVFGSRVHGVASPDSDLDIFIELPDLTNSLRQQISEIAWEIGFEEGIFISTFVATTRDLTNGPLAANPILQAINTEGIPV